jgi:hypothetical protein
MVYLSGLPVLVSGNRVRKIDEVPHFGDVGVFVRSGFKGSNRLLCLQSAYFGEIDQ